MRGKEGGGLCVNTSTAAHGVPDPNGKRETRKPSGARASALDDAIAGWKGKSRWPRVKFSVGSGKKSRRYTVLYPSSPQKAVGDACRCRPWVLAREFLPFFCKERTLGLAYCREAADRTWNKQPLEMDCRE